MGLISATKFSVCSAIHAHKVYNYLQLEFVRYMIIPILHIPDWKSIAQWNNAQINYDNVCKNTSRIDYNKNLEIRSCPEISQGINMKPHIRYQVK